MRNDLLSWEIGHSISPQGFATSVLDATGLSAEHTVQTSGQPELGTLLLT